MLVVINLGSTLLDFKEEDRNKEIIESKGNIIIELDEIIKNLKSYSDEVLNIYTLNRDIVNYIETFSNDYPAKFIINHFRLDIYKNGNRIHNTNFDYDRNTFVKTNL